jgi:hypothetical protein
MEHNSLSIRVGQKDRIYHRIKMGHSAESWHYVFCDMIVFHHFETFNLPADVEFKDLCPKCFDLEQKMKIAVERENGSV